MRGSGPVLPVVETFELTESRVAVLQLTEEEGDTLIALGRELAAKAAWWGSSTSEPTRSVISVESLRGGRCSVSFRDVVGVVSVGAKQFCVRPKIPFNHFAFLASCSEIAPRFSDARVALDQGNDFAIVLARWCVDAAEKLLRSGLLSDYADCVEGIEEIRGRVLPLETALLIASGVPRALCDFQEFSEDTALNRIVKAACLRISSTARIDVATRARARQVAFRLDSVGALRVADLRARVDRLSKSYSNVLPLSMLVLSGLGITVASGRSLGRAFLVRTPELIEDGLRSILQSGLTDTAITKRRLMLGDSGLSMNPDLVFGESLAVGDVKYRVLAPDWNKPDLNQIVTFATAFRSSSAALFGFSLGASPRLPRSIRIGDVSARAFSWIAAEGVRPEESASMLVAEVAAWLHVVRTRSQPPNLFSSA
ncbi:hypothetical protein WG922_16745 [Ramlibacter sp. AN1015]|uniref:5-methylcytosine restriction system specificity protein McrC n=1 Tax=Ramlibacter sp. AN1015 TaxID=3133428 RepID=UPI0030BF5CD7